MSARWFITASGVDFWGVYQGTNESFVPLFKKLTDKIPGTPVTTNIFSSGWIDSIKQWAFMPIDMPLEYDIHEVGSNSFLVMKTKLTSVELLFQVNDDELDLSS